MRKTSQDGEDSTFVTSGIENEIKKPGAIIKTKRNSIKRKVQNFSNESDDAVIEPLLQKDNEKTDTLKQSAKHNLLSKANKTEANSQTERDKDKLIVDYKLQDTDLSNASDITTSTFPTSYVKDNSMSKLATANAPVHNHMNTNVFSSPESSKCFVAKSQILVEIDGSKQVGYSPSPLIFTTAKIHTDGQTKHMEPVQVTPVPILSTIEVSVMKSGIHKGEFSGHVSSNISTICTNIPNIGPQSTEQGLKSLFKIPNNTTSAEVSDPNICNATDKSLKLSPSNKYTLYNAKNCLLDNSSAEIKEHTFKVTTSQPTNSSTSVTVSVPVTTSSHNYTKDAGVLSETVATARDKTYTPSYQEMKIDLNKNVKQENLDFQRSKAAKLQNDAKNSSEQTSGADNIISNTATQLGLQNIIIEKDNPISKLKQSIVSTSISNDAKSLKKSDEYQKSSEILGNTLSDKIKLPKSSDKCVPVSTATTLLLKNSLVDNKITKTNSEAKITAANKSLVFINSSGSVGNTACPLTTTTTAKKTTTALASGVSGANKITAPSSTTVTENKTISLPSIAAANKTSAPLITIVASNKISAPTSIIAVVDNIPTSNVISSVNSNTNSVTTHTLSSNTIKPTIVTTTTGVGCIKSETTNTGTMSQVTSTLSNKPLSSTLTSISKKVSKVPTTIASWQPTPSVKSPIVTTSNSNNIKTPTSVAISRDDSLKSSTSNPKPSSGKNNSISPKAAATSSTIASSGSSSISAATVQNDSKSNKINNVKKSSKS